MRRNAAGKPIVCNSDVVEAVIELRRMTRCHCSKRTAKQGHEPGALCRYADSVHILAIATGVSRE